MELTLKPKTTKLFTCVLHKKGVPKKYLPDVFFSKGEANIYAKTYLSVRKRKSLSILIEEHQVSLGQNTKSNPP